MLMALLLVLIVTAAGFALTYLYDSDSPLLVRIATGFVTGITAQALVAFALALRFGSSAVLVFISAIPFLSPLMIFRSPRIRKRVRSDFKRLFRFKGRSRYRFAHLIVSVALLGMLLVIFGGVIYTQNGNIYTNNHHNYGDLPWHIALVRGFVVGGNYPPEHLQFAGSRLTYPYLCDFITAEFNVIGANFMAAFLLTNLALAYSLLALIQHWSFRLTRSPLVMILTPLLLFFNGGWGWLMLFKDISDAHKPLWDFFLHLPHDYTMFEGKYRWGTTITVLFTTQRSILLGMPLALAVMTQLQAALRLRPAGTQTAASLWRPARRLRLVAAGGITGLLPLAHTHTGLVLLTIAGWHLLSEVARRDGRWRDWLAFFLPALLLMAPQGLMLLSGTTAHTSHFFGIEAGWDHGNDNPILFWLRNTGPFLPLLLVALFWPGTISPFVRRCYFPFVVWLILPNIFRFAPWVWDNIKVLIYGYIASIPIVLLLLARLWRQNRPSRWTAIALLVMMTLAGSIDVFRIATAQFRQQVFSGEELAFGEAVNQSVPPGVRILNAPIHNHAVCFAGRRMICGYGGHLWSHGFDYADRADAVQKIYAGVPNADALLEKYGVQYIAVGPPEHNEPGFTVNDNYLQKFPVVVSVGPYRLLQVHR